MVLRKVSVHSYYILENSPPVTVRLRHNGTDSPLGWQLLGAIFEAHHSMDGITLNNL
jgi:hypothetical protein